MRSGRDYIKKQLEINPTAMIYYDLSAGRKCPEWFGKSGLTDLQIRVKAEDLQYHGSEKMEPGFIDLVMVNEPERSIENQVNLWLEGTIKQGFVDEETVEKAKDEIRGWYQNPNAFNFWTLVFAAGRV